MALYLGKDKIAGFSTDSRIGDTLPVGAVIDYDGTEVPANWELVEEEATGSGLPEITDDTVVLSDIEDGIYICTSMRYKGDSSSTAVLFNEKNDQVLLIKASDQSNYFGVTIIQAGRSFKINYANGVVTTSPIVNIQDNLTSTSTDEALSANQGKILNDLIAELTARVAALEELHVLPTFIFDGDDYGTLTFSFEEGMTWGDFVASEYNTDNFFEVDGNMIKITNPISKLPYIIDRNNYVYTTTELVADRHYTYSTDPA